MWSSSDNRKFREPIPEIRVKGDSVEVDQMVGSTNFGPRCYLMRALYVS